MSKNNYGFKNKNNMQTGYDRYTPQGFGKVAMYIAALAGVIAVIAVLVAVFAVGRSAQVTQISFIIAFVGLVIAFGFGIVMIVDVIRFNRKQSKIQQTRNSAPEPKGMDIGRAIHMIIGIVVGIIIGYLIWGMHR